MLPSAVSSSLHIAQRFPERPHKILISLSRIIFNPFAYRRCGSAADVHASLLAGTAARCSRLMDWREAPGQKRMAISSVDGSARSVRAINKYTYSLYIPANTDRRCLYKKATPWRFMRVYTEEYQLHKQYQPDCPYSVYTVCINRFKGHRGGFGHRDLLCSLPSSGYSILNSPMHLSEM